MILEFDSKTLKVLEHLAYRFVRCARRASDRRCEQEAFRRPPTRR